MFQGPDTKLTAEKPIKVSQSLTGSQHVSRARSTSPLPRTSSSTRATTLLSQTLSASSTRSHRSASPPQSIGLQAGSGTLSVSQTLASHNFPSGTFSVSHVILLQVDDPPATKRIKVESDSDAVPTHVIKKSQLQLDDLPPELLPTHHEKILKKV